MFVARQGRSELTTTILDDGQVRDLVEKMLKSTGRRVDLSTPFVDAMLPDGSRLHVVIPDLSGRTRELLVTALTWRDLPVRSCGQAGHRPPTVPCCGPRPAVLTLGRRRRPVRSRCPSEGRRPGLDPFRLGASAAQDHPPTLRCRLLRAMHR